MMSALDQPQSSFHLVFIQEGAGFSRDASGGPGTVGAYLIHVRKSI
jgi:hypothetical protein